MASVAMGDGFLSTCDPNSIELEGTTLRAFCLNVYKDLTCSRLDLGRCLRNSYGTIQDDPQEEGHVTRHLGRPTSS